MSNVFGQNSKKDNLCNENMFYLFIYFFSSIIILFVLFKLSNFLFKKI